MQPDESDEAYFGLAQVVQVLRRRWRWVAGTVVVCVAAILFVTFQLTPGYQASSRLLLRTVAADTLLVSDPNAQVPFFADRQLQNELSVIESDDLRNAVEESVDPTVDVGSVSAEIVNLGADEIELSVTSDDPDEAAMLANLYAQEYIEYSQDQRIDAIQDAMAEIQERLDAVTAERNAVAAPLDEIDAQLVQDPDNVGLIQQRLAIADDLSPELDALDDQRAQLVQTRQNLALTQGLAPTGIAQILEAAEPPGSPSSPKPIRNGAIGFILGLGLGVALAFAREFLDQAIRNPDDLQRAVRGRYPTLGVIPAVNEDTEPITTSTHSSVAEAFRALRTSVRFVELDQPCRVIQVTSPSAGEGKTTTAANLTRVLGQAGHRVAVVCCDFRRPLVHELFSLDVTPGVADVVVGDMTLAAAVVPVDDMVHVLPAGTRPPNPSELLSSDRAERVIQAVAKQMEYVIVDTTPTLPVTDAVVVSRFVDATLVVVRAGSTTRKELERALETLELAGAPVLGLVLTGVRGGDINSYGYDYGSESRSSRRRRRSERAADGAASDDVDEPSLVS